MKPPSNDGFTSAPLWLIKIAEQEWRDSGRLPGRRELAERLEKEWYADVALWREMLERGRPEPEEHN